MSHPLQLTLMIVLFILSCSVQFFFSVIGYKVLHSLPLYQGLLAAPLQCSLGYKTCFTTTLTKSFLTGLAACMSIFGYNSFKGLQPTSAAFSWDSEGCVHRRPRRGVECQERSDGESKVVSGAGPGGKLSGGSASGGLLVFNSNVEQASVIWFVSFKMQ